MTRHVVVGYHGHCFDGMSSAAVFTRLLSELSDEPLAFSYKGLDHQPGGSHVPPNVLSGDLNAVVDFRYPTSERLHWWLDHHISGIGNVEERAHFESDTSGKKFFDPNYGSCCKLIADTARERFGVELTELSDLVHWADIIDAARFESAEHAVALREPALRLMTVIEAHGNDAFLVPRIQKLAAGATLAELAAEPEVERLLAPLLAEHEVNCQAVRERASLTQGVVCFDLVGTGRERYNKFIPYWLFPESRYCVAVTASASRAKVSVGSNPWATEPRTHNIARLCERFGGGGHPVVGAVSLRPSQVERARDIALEIASELSSG